MLLFVAGTSWRHLAALAGLVCVAVAFVLVAGPAVGVKVLKPYQTERLTAFLHPSSPSSRAQKEATEAKEAAEGKEPKEGTEATDPSYQQEESKIAIGSGGKTGRGVHGEPGLLRLRAGERHRLHVRRRRRKVRLRRRRARCCSCTRC